MRLQLAQTVVGDPTPGDVLHVFLEDGTRFNMIYKPHRIWLDHIWFAEDAHLHLRDVRVELLKLASRGIESEWMTVYADHKHPLVIGCPLHLTLLPNGNMSSWPRIQTKKVKSIVVN